MQVLEQGRSEEHTSELQSRLHLVCRLLLEKKNISANPISLATAAAPCVQPPPHRRLDRLALLGASRVTLPGLTDHVRQSYPQLTSDTLVVCGDGQHQQSAVDALLVSGLIDSAPSDGARIECLIDAILVG